MESRSETAHTNFHRTIWRIANDLRGSVDGWDFNAYVPGMPSCRFILENLTGCLKDLERKLGQLGVDHALLANDDAKRGRSETVHGKHIPGRRAVERGEGNGHGLTIGIPHRQGRRSRAEKRTVLERLGASFVVSADQGQRPLVEVRCP